MLRPGTRRIERLRSLERQDRIPQLHHVHRPDGRYPRNHGVVRRIEGGAQLGQVDPLDRGNPDRQDRVGPPHGRQARARPQRCDPRPQFQEVERL